MIYAVMDGSQTYQWGDSAIAAVVAILMVFLILGMIIAITHLVFKALGYLDIKKAVDESKKSTKPAEIPAKPAQFDENDEEAWNEVYGMGYASDFFPMAVTLSRNLLGIEESIMESGLQMEVFPNPAKDRVVIEGIEAAEVQIFNTIGQCVASATGKGEPFTIDISNLPTGVYFVNVTDGEGRKCVKKVVKE